MRGFRDQRLKKLTPESRAYLAPLAIGDEMALEEFEQGGRQMDKAHRQLVLGGVAMYHLALKHIDRRPDAAQAAVALRGGQLLADFDVHDPGRRQITTIITCQQPTQRPI